MSACPPPSGLAASRLTPMTGPGRRARREGRSPPVAAANEIGGRVRVAYGVYEASSLASGDVINMFRLPQGARIIEGSLSHDALGSSTTLAVGHAAYTNSGGTAVGADGTHFKAAAASTSATGSVAVANTLALGKFELVDLDQEVKDNGFDVTT